MMNFDEEYMIIDELNSQEFCQIFSKELIISIMYRRFPNEEPTVENATRASLDKSDVDWYASSQRWDKMWCNGVTIS